VNEWIDRADERGEALATVRLATSVPIRDSLAHAGTVGDGPGSDVSVIAGVGVTDGIAERGDVPAPFQVPASGARITPAIRRSAAVSPRSSHRERRPRGWDAGPGGDRSLVRPDTRYLEIPSPRPAVDDSYPVKGAGPSTGSAGSAPGVGGPPGSPVGSGLGSPDGSGLGLGLGSGPWPRHPSEMTRLFADPSGLSSAYAVSVSGSW
jgi:hypothetical protein